jgi:membrane protein
MVSWGMLAILRTIVVSTWNGFFDNRLTSMAAAIAFYAIFSLAPILIVAISVAEPVLGRMAAEENLLAQLGDMIGIDNVDILRRAMERKLLSGDSWLPTLFGVGALLYSGTAIFVELDSALAVIWRQTEPNRPHPVLAEIRSRLLALLLMMVVGVSFLAAILFGIAMSGYDSVLKRFPLVGGWLGPALSEGWTLVVTAAFFTLIYKFLPDSHRPWRFALISGVAVAFLMALGTRAITWYFAYTKLGSAFGAAGALAAAMVWIYYSAIIVLVAAQVGRATRDALQKRPADAPAVF